MRRTSSRVDLPRPLVPQLLFDVALDRRRLVRRDGEDPAELEGEFREADRVGVEDRDIPGDLVRHVHLVAVLRPGGSACRPWRARRRRGAARRRATRLGNGRSVVPRRMSPGRFIADRLAARPAGDRLLHSRKTSRLIVVGRAALRSEILQPGLVVVLVRQLEDRLVELAGPARARRLRISALVPRRPCRRASQRGAEAGQLGRRGRRPGPRRRAGAPAGRTPATRGVTGPSTACATTCALCSPNARSTTRRAPRIVPTPMVMARRGTHSSPPKKSLAASRRVTRSSVIRRVRLVARRARLVEADVAGPADAEDLQVDAARLRDRLLVGAGSARRTSVGVHGAVGDVDVLRRRCRRGRTGAPA